MRSIFHRDWRLVVLGLLIGLGFGASKAAAQPGAADLQVRYTNSPATVTLGQYFTCSVYVHNPGWDIATNIVVTNQIPPGLEFVSVMSTRGTCSQAGGVVTWNVGDFLPSYFATMTMEFKATGLGAFTNFAAGTSTTPESDPTNNQATFITRVTKARFFGVGRPHAAYNNPRLTTLPNNQLLVTGAWPNKAADIYDPPTRSFTVPTGSLTVPRSAHAAILLTNGLVLLAGGASSTGAKTAEVYDPVWQSFRRVGDMLAYSYDHRATQLPDGRILLCGGALATNELYNAATETFSPDPAGLVCPPTGTRLPDGRYFQGSSTPSIYDPATGISTSTGPLNVFRFNWTATLIPPDKVLVAGGDRNSDAAELYDIPSGTFSLAPKMTTPRHYHGATLLADGTVLIVGGINDQFPVGQDRAEGFDLDGTVNVPGIGVSDASVVEDDSGTNWMQFTVWLTTNSALPVAVNFTTVAGTAGWFDWGVANVDFANTNGTLTLPPGVTNATLSIPVFGDSIWEPSETFSLVLSLPTQAWLARTTATGTILNNDPLPTLSVLPGALTEGDLGRSNMTLEVSLSLPTPSTVTVDYFTTNGSAAANTDYFPTNGTLVFGAGTTSLTVEVPVVGDLTPESDETFLLQLTNAQNATLASSSAPGTILNDDAVPGRLHHFDWASIPSPQVQAAGFPVTLMAKDYFGAVVTNVPWPVRLSAETTNYVAANLDFEAPSLAPWVTFNYTPYEKSFSQQPAEVSGLGPASMAFRTGAGGGTNGIAQDIFLRGGIPYVFSADIMVGREESGDSTCWGGMIYLQVGTNSAATELPTLCGGYARMKISLAYTPPTDGIYPLQFTIYRSYFWVSDSYFVYLDDVQISYPVITPTVATNFTNGVWTGVVAALQAGTNISLFANDKAGHLGASNPFEVLPATDLGLSVTTNWPATLRTGDKLTFNLAVTNRGPTAGSDALLRWAIPTNLTFLSASNQLGTITNEGGQLAWTLGALAVTSNATATVVLRADIPGPLTNTLALTNSIIDLNPNDNLLALPVLINPPLLAISDASGTEANASSTGLLFAVTLSGPSGQTVSVDYTTVNGTATNNLDFAATNGILTFLPGSTNASLVVYARDDILDEPDRTFTVQLTNLSNATFSDAVGSGTVIDDDAPPAIEIADASNTEGDSGTKNLDFSLTLSKPAIVNVTVRCSTVPGLAGTNDFIPTTNTLSFPAGTTATTFSVPIRGNTVNEPDETFTVALSLPANATIGSPSAVGTILNDDAVPGRLDHFLWDAITSPQNTGWPFPVLLRAVDYLGNPATNAGIAALVTARTENGYLSRLQDDFEDGNSIGWTNYIVSFNTVVTNETAAGGNNSLRLTGGTGSPSAGLRSTFTNITPNRISFAVRASRTNQIAGRFTASASGTYRSAVFYCNNNGQMGLLDRTLGFRGVPYQSNRWYQVDLTLNWPAQKIDCRIDGALVLTNITFPDNSATFLSAVLLANQDNTTSWWDNLRVCHDNLTNTLAVTPSNFVAFASGIKSNLVTLNSAAPKVWLIADDGNEHVGTSGVFDLELFLRLGITPPTALSNVVKLAIAGAPGFNYRVESSTNLTRWTILTNLQSTGMVMRVQFPPAPGPGGVFYRTVVP